MKLASGARLTEEPFELFPIRTRRHSPTPMRSN
jgi:hypothetical protein